MSSSESVTISSNINDNQDNGFHQKNGQQKSSSERSFDSSIADSFEWTTENEVHLFQLLSEYKPVGINRCFNMIGLLHHFNKLTSKDNSSTILWDHLDTMYNLEYLNANDPLTFSNEMEDFQLNDTILSDKKQTGISIEGGNENKFDESNIKSELSSENHSAAESVKSDCTSGIETSSGTSTPITPSTSSNKTILPVASSNINKRARRRSTASDSKSSETFVQSKKRDRQEGESVRGHYRRPRQEQITTDKSDDDTYPSTSSRMESHHKTSTSINEESNNSSLTIQSSSAKQRDNSYESLSFKDSTKDGTGTSNYSKKGSAPKLRNSTPPLANLGKKLRDRISLSSANTTTPSNFGGSGSTKHSTLEPNHTTPKDGSSTNKKRKMSSKASN
ncbi:hypothetical protein RDWZM_002326 [Blomia tropicalis]|uniref:MRG-binding protein n=1 Tax=Blomia tropicalis TaxID=40697 RepID=A0A9Q0RS45_BLOTA|nr:hypothetical protein RDWZM_002326 [Blomia tropicalis]